MKRAYKANRAKARTPYETYSYWYDIKTKSAQGKKKYHEKLTAKEFDKVYRQARDLGWKNPAKTIAQKQRKIDYNFQKNYEAAMGVKLKAEDFETKEARQALFMNFTGGNPTDELREAFETLY